MPEESWTQALNFKQNFQIDLNVLNKKIMVSRGKFEDADVFSRITNSFP